MCRTRTSIRRSDWWKVIYVILSNLMERLLSNLNHHQEHAYANLNRAYCLNIFGILEFDIWLPFYHDMCSCIA